MLDFGLGLLLCIGCLVSVLLDIGMVVVHMCISVTILGLLSRGPC